MKLLVILAAATAVLQGVVRSDGLRFSASGTSYHVGSHD